MINKLNKRTFIRVLSLLLVLTLTVNTVLAPKRANAFLWSAFLPAAFSVPVVGQAALAIAVIGAGAYVGLKYNDKLNVSLGDIASKITSFWGTLSPSVQDEFTRQAESGNPEIEMTPEMKQAVSSYVRTNIDFNPTAEWRIPEYNLPTYQNGTNYTAATTWDIVNRYAPIFFEDYMGNDYVYMPESKSYSISEPEINLKMWKYAPNNGYTQNISGSHPWTWYSGYSSGYTAPVYNPYTAPALKNLTDVRIRVDGTLGIGEYRTTVNGSNITVFYNSAHNVVYDFYDVAIYKIAEVLVNVGFAPTFPNWVTEKKVDVGIPITGIKDTIPIPEGALQQGEAGTTVTVTQAGATTISQAYTGATTAEPPTGGGEGFGPKTPPWAPLAMILAFFDLIRAIVMYMGRALIFLMSLITVPMKPLGNEGMDYLLNFRITGTESKYFTNVIPMDISLIDLVRTLLTLGMSFAIYRAVTGAVNNGIETYLLFQRKERP